MSAMGIVWRQLLGFTISSACLLSAISVRAQITPDRTLPNNSNVTINGSTFNITGGTQAGRNLFHSFQTFSVPTGGRALFSNGSDIQNIFSRVTGNSASTIDGIIQANGSANLFFLNPHGIIFGKNASLNVGGSFVATTANAIQFGNLGSFSASEPNSPALLTVNPTALFYNQINAGTSIQNNSSVPSGLDPSNTVSATGLRVPDGRSLLLVGGDVSMTNGGLFAFGGRVELGGLSAPGAIGLVSNNSNDFSLSFPTNVQRGDVSLSNGASVNVAAGGGGNIVVNARNLSLATGSTLVAGIGQGLGNVGTQAGDVTINATGDVKLDGNPSDIRNDVQARAIGNGGNISVSSNSLELTNGAQLEARTFGQGNPGNVTVNASSSISFDGRFTNSDGSFIASGILDNVGQINNNLNSSVKGNGGNIQITTPQLSFTNGAQIEASTFGQGNAGNVIINAPNIVSLNGSGSIIFSTVGLVNNNQNNLAIGSGGNIQINTGQLSLTNGAQLQTSTFGQGSAGNVVINATKSVSLTDSGTDAFSTVGTVNNPQNNLAIGNGGNIQITTSELSLASGAALVASTYGQGNAGSVIVNAPNSVSLNGSGSAIFSTVGSSNSNQNNIVRGNGGNIQVNTSQLSLTNGAQLQASTFGKGNAGNVIINALDKASIDGATIFSTVGDVGLTPQQNSIANGKGGNIQITTNQLSLTNGGRLITSTSGQGNPGNVSINAGDAVILTGTSKGISAILSTINPTGVVQSTGADKGGNIDIHAGSLSVTDGAQLAASTLGRGNAGNVNVNATNAVTIAGVNDNVPSSINSFVGNGAIGNSGEIKITTGSVSLTDGGQLIASTSGQGSPGNISINAGDAVILAGESSGNSSGIFSTVNSTGVVQSTGKDKGGNININVASLSVTGGAQLAASTFGKGDAGNVTVNASKNVFFDGGYPNSNGQIVTSGIFSTVGDASHSPQQNSTAQGRGGNIEIITPRLSLTNGAQLQASTYGQGDAGNVNINVTNALTIAGVNKPEGVNESFPSSIRSTIENGAIGKGGNIDIHAGSLSVTDGAQLQASTFGKGDAGNVIVNASKNISLDNSSFIFSTVADYGAIGKGGDIQITTPQLFLSNFAGFVVSTFGQGNAGNVIINAAKSISLDNRAIIFSNSSAGYKGGDIQITTPQLSLSNVSFLDASNLGQGDAGNLEITSGSIRLNNGFITALTSSGKGGNITLAPNDLLLLQHGSQISTTAANTQLSGNGGRITINTPDGFVVGTLKQNKEITANAFKGAGGIIQLNALGVYNFSHPSLNDLETQLKTSDPITLDQDLQVTPTNYVTAISLTNPTLSGQVNIVTPDIDPARGLIILPTFAENQPKLLSSNCSAFNEANGGNNFTVTGRGGLPTNPYEPLSSDAIWSDTRLPLTTNHQHQRKKHAAKVKPQPIAIVPATGWVFNDKGEVTLISSVSNATSSQTPASCPAR